MAAQVKEVFLPAIENALYAALSLIAGKYQDDSPFVIGAAGGYKVIRHEAGSMAVKKNNVTYPVSASKRVDNPIEYALNNYEVGPELIQRFKEVQQLPYDKQVSVMAQQMSALGENVLFDFFQGWYHNTAGGFLTTTGDAVTAHAPDATGTRKGMTYADTGNLRKLFTTQKIPVAGRYLALDGNMIQQLIDDMGPQAARNAESVVNVAEGAIMKVNSFNIIESPFVGYVTAAGTTTREYNATGAATDNAFGLAWHENFVGGAISSPYTYTDEDNPTYFGSLMSADQFANASQLRNSKIGVVPIVQAATA